MTMDKNSAHKEPPKGVFGSLRYLGPGLILSASIVGSGELIATTALGAKAGFAVLWVLILGCLIKVAVQLEYGRFCICHGIPSFQAWNGLAGPRFLGLHWSIHVGLVSFAAMVDGNGCRHGWGGAGGLTSVWPKQHCTLAWLTVGDYRASCEQW